MEMLTRLAQEEMNIEAPGDLDDFDARTMYWFYSVQMSAKTQDWKQMARMRDSKTTLQVSS